MTASKTVKDLEINSNKMKDLITVKTETLKSERN